MRPQRIWPVMRSPILSLRGKLRLACERFVPARRDETDESVAAFARRRLGREAYERLVQPLVGGIYTAEPEKLSLAATMPRFAEMERRHGSLIRAVRADRRSGETESVVLPDDAGRATACSCAPREGLSSFMQAIAARLPQRGVRLNTNVNRIEQAGNKWRLFCQAAESAGQPEQIEVDGVIIATPATAAARLLNNVDTALAAELSGIEYAGCAIVALGYDRSQIRHPLDSFGFVVPAIERRRILSASFSSLKFPGRAPEGKVLIRVFLGGALQPEMLALNDDHCAWPTKNCKICSASTAGPALSEVYRWHGAMPQYHFGHLERLQRINERISRLPGMALAGNAYQGVGIPHCIASGEQAAERILHKLPPASRGVARSNRRLMALLFRRPWRERRLWPQRPLAWRPRRVSHRLGRQRQHRRQESGGAFGSNGALGPFFFLLLFLLLDRELDHPHFRQAQHAHRFIPAFRFFQFSDAF